MTDRPIPFTGPMVRAILAGTKTQTRRVVKLEDHKLPLAMGYWRDGADGSGKCVDPNGPVWSFGRRVPGDPHNMYVHERVGCPYGQPGDRLWVKEELRKWGNQSAEYAADGTKAIEPFPWRWKRAALPGMFMPRLASRITLEITGVRVERLQEISGADCFSEGVSPSCANPRVAYRNLWESINGPASWIVDPWVWVVSFRRVQS